MIKDPLVEAPIVRTTPAATNQASISDGGKNASACRIYGVITQLPSNRFLFLGLPQLHTLNALPKSKPISLSIQLPHTYIHKIYTRSTLFESIHTSTSPSSSP